MEMQSDEKILHEIRPARQVLVLWLFTRRLPIAVVLSIMGGIAPMFIITISRGIISSVLVLLGVLLAVGVLLLVCGLSFIYCVFLRRTYVYYVTNYHCIFEGGIIRRVQHFVSYRKVTDVEISQNIIEKFLGISTLKIFTPGTSSFEPSGSPRAEIEFVGLKESATPAKTINGLLRMHKE